MTRRNRDVFNYIQGYINQHKYAPSYEEIGQGCSLRSKSSVHSHVTKLIKEGWLETDHEGCPRALRVSAKGDELL